MQNDMQTFVESNLVVSFVGVPVLVSSCFVIVSLSVTERRS
jgi:hypothetical protein